MIGSDEDGIMGRAVGLMPTGSGCSVRTVLFQNPILHSKCYLCRMLSI